MRHSFTRIAVSSSLGIAAGFMYRDEIDTNWKRLSNMVANRFEVTSSAGLEFKSTKKNLSSVEGFMQTALAVANGCGGFAVLSTSSISDNTTTLHSRMIQPFAIEKQPGKDGGLVVYFNTNKLSRKFRQLSSNPSASITYIDVKKMAYVTMSGKVHRVPYPQSSKYWGDMLYMFYPEGNDESAGSRFTVFKLEPSSIEFVSVTESFTSEREDWKPPTATYDSNKKVWTVTCTGAES